MPDNISLKVTANASRIKMGYLEERRSGGGGNNKSGTYGEKGKNFKN